MEDCIPLQFRHWGKGIVIFRDFPVFRDLSRKGGLDGFVNGGVAFLSLGPILGLASGHLLARVVGRHGDQRPLAAFQFDLTRIPTSA